MSDPKGAHRVTLPIASGRDVARWLWSACAGRRIPLLGVLVLFLAEAALALVFPLVVGRLVDVVVAGTDGAAPGEFWWQIGILGAAAVIAGVLAWGGGAALAHIAETVIAELREQYVDAALRLPRSTVERAGSGDVVTRASDDIAHISGTLPDVLPKMSVSLFTIVFVAAGLGSLNPWFLVGFAVVLPAHLLTLRWYVRTAPQVYASERAAQSVRGQRILGTLTQAPAVSAHGVEQKRLELIGDATWESARWAMRTRIVQNRLFGRLNITEALGLLTVLGVGVWLAARAVISPGEATSAALLFLQTVGPIAALLLVMDELQSAFAALGRVVGVVAMSPAEGPSLDLHAEPDLLAGTGACGDASAVVTFDNVSFSYDGRTRAVDGVTFQLLRGETLAVVGATGSGKTTFAALAAGVHDPDSGRVRRAVPLTRTVTVEQESHLFADSVRANLTIAAPGVTDAQVSEALDVVGATTSVEVLPDGVDTCVGRGGHQVAPALTQQLALARAHLADPAVLVLDEATADAGASDTVELEAAAARVVRGRSALVIAHRLSQAAAADRIIVMGRGRIVESGTHSELVRAGGVYAELWAAWSAGEQ